MKELTPKARFLLDNPVIIKAEIDKNPEKPIDVFYKISKIDKELSTLRARIGENEFRLQLNVSSRWERQYIFYLFLCMAAKDINDSDLLSTSDKRMAEVFAGLK